MSNLLKLTIILTKAKVADIATRRLLSFGDKMNAEEEGTVDGKERKG